MAGPGDREYLEAKAVRLEDRVAVVTGAAGHIGSAIVARLLAEGALVVASDRAFPAQERDHARITRVSIDLREPGAGTQLIDRAVQVHGRVDALVLNAGKATDGDLDQAEEGFWHEDIEVNLTTNLGLVGAAIGAMRAQGGGAIVAISSVNAHADFGTPAYSAAKAGLESLMRSVAARHGRDGVRANSLVLGTILTQAWHERVERDPAVFDRIRQCFPLGRVGKPADVAGVVAFLTSDETAWMTGASIVLDGGLLIANPAFTSAIFGTE